MRSIRCRPAPPRGKASADDRHEPRDDVVDLLRQLRLPHMRAAAPDLLATAKAQRWDPAEAIRALLTEELTRRQASSIRSRRKAAGFPTGKTFDGWDETISSIAEPTQRALRTLEWIDRHENIVVCGPSGTGKSHFLEALGHAAIDRAPTCRGSASNNLASSSDGTESTTRPAARSARSSAPM
jgi:DNA replication protein DnaC